MARLGNRQGRRGEGEWSSVLKSSRSSGLSARAFCLRRGLALSTFQRWRDRLGAVAGAEFVEIEPSTPAPSKSWELEIGLPNGVQLRFRG